jgi:predicted AAA+ superfamily ATPase
MSLFESGDSVGAVSLAELFDGKFEPAQVKTTSKDLVNLTCRGGWPEAIDLSGEDAQEIAREYLRLFRTVTTPSQGKDPETMRRMLFSLARNLGQAATYKTLAADAGDASAEAVPSESAVSSYLELLRASYVVDEVPGWLPPARSAKRIRTKPKRYLADPSLAVAQLALLPEALLEDWQTFGLVFENLCIRDLQVYAEAQELCGDVPVRYYRDSTGLEADAIIELADGRWAAFEIKTSEAKVPDGVASLKRLRSKLTENPRARVRPPEFMAVITGVSEYAHRVEDGIYAIPIRALTA